MNIMAKHDGQATVASLELQNRQTGESDEIAAPQLGQLRVSACIADSGPCLVRPLLKLNIVTTRAVGKILTWRSRPEMNQIGMRMNEIGAWSGWAETANLKPLRQPGELGQKLVSDG